MAETAVKMRWKHQFSLSDNKPPDNPDDMYRKVRQKGCPLQKPFIQFPLPGNIDTEEELRRLHRFVSNTIKEAEVTPNLTTQQKAGIRSLKSRENLHISVSDRGGDFVVADKLVHRSLTINHITTTAGVYKGIHPTTTHNGREQPVARPIQISVTIDRSRQKQPNLRISVTNFGMISVTIKNSEIR